jgi:hypothetical protein
MSECRHGFDEGECDLCITAARPASERAGSREGQTFTLIYAPSLREDTFLHLNQQGDSWKIRHYGSPHRAAEEVAQSSEKRTRRMVDLTTLEIVHQIPYPYSNTPSGVTVEDPRYWFDEIAKANAKHNVGAETKHRSYTTPDDSSPA